MTKDRWRAAFAALALAAGASGAMADTPLPAITEEPALAVDIAPPHSPAQPTSDAHHRTSKNAPGERVHTSDTAPPWYDVRLRQAQAAGSEAWGMVIDISVNTYRTMADGTADTAGGARDRVFDAAAGAGALADHVFEASTGLAVGAWRLADDATERAHAFSVRAYDGLNAQIELRVAAPVSRSTADATEAAARVVGRAYQFSWDAAAASVDAVSRTARAPFRWWLDLRDRVRASLDLENYASFAELVNKSGFAISSVSVDAGLLPTVGVEFVHIRNLSPAERAKLRRNVANHSSTLSSLVGALERGLLEVLIEAGVVAGETQLHKVEVSAFLLFPVPSVTLHFDPFNFTHHRQSAHRQALDLVAMERAELRRLATRQSDFERRVMDVIARTEGTAPANGAIPATR